MFSLMWLTCQKSSPWQSDSCSDDFMVFQIIQSAGESDWALVQLLEKVTQPLFFLIRDNWWVIITTTIISIWVRILQRNRTRDVLWGIGSGYYGGWEVLWSDNYTLKTQKAGSELRLKIRGADDINPSTRSGEGEVRCPYRVKNQNRRGQIPPSFTFCPVEGLNGLDI